jgi:hypothetical protein
MHPFRLSPRPQQVIHTDELVALARQVFEQFAEARLELVRPSRARTDVQQQNKPIQNPGPQPSLPRQSARPRAADRALRAPSSPQAATAIRA